jgi:hypothetical protein
MKLYLLCYWNNKDGICLRKNAGKNICIYKRHNRIAGNCITRKFTICILHITLSSKGDWGRGESLKGRHHLANLSINTKIILREIGHETRLNACMW